MNFPEGKTLAKSVPGHDTVLNYPGYLFFFSLPALPLFSRLNSFLTSISIDGPVFALYLKGF